MGVSILLLKLMEIFIHISNLIIYKELFIIVDTNFILLSYLYFLQKRCLSKIRLLNNGTIQDNIKSFYYKSLL